MALTNIPLTTSKLPLSLVHCNYNANITSLSHVLPVKEIVGSNDNNCWSMRCHSSLTPKCSPDGAMSHTRSRVQSSQRESEYVGSAASSRSRSLTAFCNGMGAAREKYGLSLCCESLQSATAHLLSDMFSNLSPSKRSCLLGAWAFVPQRALTSLPLHHTRSCW